MTPPSKTDLFFLGDAFFQANTIKGHRYLDVAGELMNDLEDRFGILQPGIGGLIIAAPKDPKDYLAEARITGGQIWLHSREQTPWVVLRRDVPTLVERYATMMEVRGYSRRGLRVYLICPLSPLAADEADRRFARVMFKDDVLNWGGLGKTIGTQIIAQLEDEHEHLKVRVSLAPAVRSETPRDSSASVDTARTESIKHLDQDLPITVLFADVDLFDDRETLDLDVRPFMGRAIGYLEEKMTRFLTRVVESVSG